MSGVALSTTLRMVSAQESASGIGEVIMQTDATVREMYNNTLLCVGPYI